VVEAVTAADAPPSCLLATPVPFDDLPADPLAAGACDYRHVTSTEDAPPVVQGVRWLVQQQEMRATLDDVRGKFEGVFETSDGAIAILDPDGTLRDINERADRFLADGDGSRPTRR